MDENIIITLEQIEALEEHWRHTEQIMRSTFKAARVGLTIDRSKLSPSKQEWLDAQEAYIERMWAIQASLEEGAEALHQAELLMYAKELHQCAAELGLEGESVENFINELKGFQDAWKQVEKGGEPLSVDGAACFVEAHLCDRAGVVSSVPDIAEIQKMNRARRRRAM